MLVSGPRWVPLKNPKEVGQLGLNLHSLTLHVDRPETKNPRVEVWGWCVFFGVFLRVGVTCTVFWSFSMIRCSSFGRRLVFCGFDDWTRRRGMAMMVVVVMMMVVVVVVVVFGDAAASDCCFCFCLCCRCCYCCCCCCCGCGCGCCCCCCWWWWWWWWRRLLSAYRFTPTRMPARRSSWNVGIHARRWGKSPTALRWHQRLVVRCICPPWFLKIFRNRGCYC